MIHATPTASAVMLSVVIPVLNTHPSKTGLRGRRVGRFVSKWYVFPSKSLGGLCERLVGRWWLRDLSSKLVSYVRVNKQTWHVTDL
jgi:hypothetical protein